MDYQLVVKKVEKLVEYLDGKWVDSLVACLVAKMVAKLDNELVASKVEM
jgi:hypothetical protein